MTAFDKMAAKIVKEQALVIGPLAWIEAAKVQGLVADRGSDHIEITGPDQSQAIDRLVAQYERLFGRASHEVCREAAANIIAELPAGDVPVSLRS